MKKPRHNTVEINGKLYDAKSGKPITHPKKTSVKSIDGINKTSAKQSSGKPVARKSGTASAVRKKPTRTAAPKATTSLKRSKTLHRRSVSRPSVQVEKPVTTTTDRQVPTGIIPKLDRGRAKRSERITRSAIIGRFYTDKPARTSPASSVKKTQQPRTAASTGSIKAPSKPPVVQRPQMHGAAAKRAIDNHRKSLGKHRRLASYATTLAVVLVLAGYVTYLNVPGISMRVAANRAGFAASLPAAPSGYRLSGPITHSPGQVVVNFKSNTDNRHFSLTQQPTTWDSLALLENYVMKQSSEYTTYQDRGLTIYLYQDNSVAWVNNGKMHIIDGRQAQLAINQVLDIASSM